MDIFVLFLIFLDFILWIGAFIFTIKSVFGPDTTEQDEKDGRKIPELNQKGYGGALLALVLMVIIALAYVG